MLCLLCIAVAGAAGATQSQAVVSPSPEAIYQRLLHRATAALGEERLGCLVPVSDTYGSPIGFSLRVTTHRALAAARRFKDANRKIIRLEVVAPRFSLASMRSVYERARTELAAFPEASPALSLTLGEREAKRGRCAPIRIKVPEASAATRAADAVQQRYGTDRILVEILIGSAAVPVS